MNTPYISVAIYVNDEVFAECANFSSTYPDPNNGSCMLIKSLRQGDVVKIQTYSSTGSPTYNVVSNLTFS